MSDSVFDVARLTAEDVARIPQELRKFRQWVTWKLELRDGRATKVPHNARTSEPASTTDPATWSSFEEAWAAYERSTVWSGIGFVFSADDPFLGIDFDKCRIPQTGTLDENAERAIAELNSYCEASPSGMGAHVIVRARMPGERRGRRRDGIELYDNARYFTVTGRTLNGAHGIEERQAAVDALLARRFPGSKPATNGAQPTAAPPDVDAKVFDRIRAMPDEEVLKRIARSHEAEKFLRLWGGNFSAYPSQSEADAALCLILARYCAKDAARIERLFSQSGLARREKWTGRPDYRRGVVDAACAFVQKIWTPERRPDSYILKTLREILDAEYPPEKWQLEGLLPAGGTSIVAAKPKVGKTVFVRQLALCTATGRSFLECTVRQGPVVLLSFQGRERDIADHFRSLGATGDEPIHVFCARAPDGAVEKLQEMVEQYQPVLVIIDLLENLIKVEDGNSYSEVTHALEPLEDIARQSGAHLMATHHLGKGEREDAADALMGSTGYRAACDTIVLLKRYAEYRTIRTEQRIGTELPETILTWNAEQQALFLGPTKTGRKVKTVTEKILIALRTSKEPMTQDEILAATGIRTGETLAALEQLKKDKKIVCTGTGKRGSRFRYAISDSFPGSGKE